MRLKIFTILNSKKIAMIQDNIEPPRQTQQALIDEDKPQLHSLYDQARKQFIQKVFVVLGFQVIFTVSTLLLMIYSQTFFNFQQANTFLCVICIAGCLSSHLLIVRNKLNRQYPRNIILLLTYTIGQSYSVSYLCGAQLVTDFKNIIFISAIITLVVIMACAIYTYKTKKDFTTEATKVIGGITSLLMVAVVLIFENQIIIILICCFAMYIDLKVITEAGERTISVDNNMVYALKLYTDILQLFICIIMLPSAGNK